MLFIIQTLPGVDRPAPLSHQEQQQVKILSKKLSNLGEVRSYIWVSSFIANFYECNA